jgi:FkbM family methyltransferase
MDLRIVRDTLRVILAHPLNQGRRATALLDYAKWQIGSRMMPGPVVVPVVDDARLVVRPKQHSTLIAYTGIYDFEDICFVLHAIGPGDLLVDVGANVGIYSVLAAKVRGASAVAFEPVPASLADLKANIGLNGVGATVEVHSSAVGSAKGTVTMTTDRGGANHVLAPDAKVSGKTVTVDVVRLDDALEGRSPRVLKIDVEGFEAEVLRGAGATLVDPSLKVIVLEVVGHGAAYGFDESDNHRLLVRHGFTVHEYDPWTRTLRGSPTKVSRSLNRLYVRDVDALQASVRDAPRIFIHHRRVWV